jgi:DNA helicase-2/ATP-dependent DNA helicase PcrA
MHGVLKVELKKLRSRFIQERKFYRQRGITTEALGKYIAATKAYGYATVLPSQAHDVVIGDGAWRLAQFWGRTLRIPTDTLMQFQQAMESVRLSKNVYDFDDMLLWAWRSLVFNPEVLSEFRGRFSHILVDEVQDSNQLQWDVAYLLSGETSKILVNTPSEEDGNFTTSLYDAKQFTPPEAMPPDIQNALLVYGDPAQSIYRFRHAMPSKLLNFTLREDVSVYQLRYNYRSAQGICKLGETIAEDKAWNLSDCIIPVGVNRTVPIADTIQTQAHASLMEEAYYIVMKAKELASEAPQGLNDCAVLCRVSIPLSFVELICMQLGVPWVKYASGSFIDSKDIKLVLAYIKAAMGGNYDPTGEVMLSLVNKPFRFIKKAFVESCAQEALQKNKHPIDILLARSRELNPKPAEAMQDFVSLMTQLNRMAMTEESKPSNAKEVISGPRVMIRCILRDTDYVRRLREEDGPSTEADRLSALEELLKIADKFIKPSEFLRHIQELSEIMHQVTMQRQSQRGKDGTKLTLSTIHRAKGLEWRHVFLMGVNKGIFPHEMADKEEEQRLFYVASTRAKNTLDITYTNVAASLEEEHKSAEDTSVFVQTAQTFLNREHAKP